MKVVKLGEKMEARIDADSIAIYQVSRNNLGVVVTAELRTLMGRVSAADLHRELNGWLTDEERNEARREVTP